MHISYKSGKVDIEAPKVDIEGICKDRIRDITQKSIQHIIEPVKGLGKGKYRFLINS